MPFCKTRARPVYALQGTTSDDTFEPSITAVPQWTWTEADCKTWLRTLLTERLHCRYFIERKLNRFKENGDWIYMITREEWKGILGKGSGEFVYELLMQVRAMARLPMIKTEGEEYNIVHLRVVWLDLGAMRGGSAEGKGEMMPEGG